MNVSYDEVTRALAAVGSDLDGAECHGMLCGMLATSDAFDAEKWLEHAAGRADLTPFGPPGSGHVVWELLELTRRAFEGGEFALELLLPDDETDIDERAGALAAFSRGFLSGYGLSGGGADYALVDAEAREFLNDLTELSKLDTDIEPSETSEAMLAELTEFVKLGTLMMYEQTPAGETTNRAAPNRLLH